MIDERELRAGRTTLDPLNWDELRALGHRMLDDMIDHVATVRDRPVWQPIPDDVRSRFADVLPAASTDPAAVYREFSDFIAPFSTGNLHPRFMGWVHGGGSAIGMLAEMLASGLNANLGGRDHVPIEVERQVVRWMGELFGFPSTASGILVTGTSMANLMAVLVARRDTLGAGARQDGVSGEARRLCAYTSRAAHGCIARAMDISGLGTAALRCIATDHAHRIDLLALQDRIDRDRAEGLRPFLVIASAGTVDIGAIDDLAAIAAFCRDNKLWFHVDGAFGALGMLSSAIAPKLRGIEAADSIALDFHKWGQVPYDAGFLLVRDGERHRAAFAAPAAYLQRETRGLAAGPHWPCDFGPDLSRGFRALKVWFTLKVFGRDALGAMIERTCALARHLQRRVAAEPMLELLAPVELNIVCFRYRAADADHINRAIVIALQEAGIAAPSTTVLDGKLAIRCAIVNHRTEERDVDVLVAAVLDIGARLTASPDGLLQVEAPPLAV